MECQVYKNLDCPADCPVQLGLQEFGLSRQMKPRFMQSAGKALELPQCLYERHTPNGPPPVFGRDDPKRK